VRRLSRGEERELSAAAKAGDFRARERLAVEALAAAHFVVLRFKQAYRDILYDDFMSAAQPAILRALRAFDPREYRLRTLVDKAVTNELRKYSKRRVKLAKRELLTDFQNYDSYNGAEGDDQNPYDANAADLAWKAASFKARFGENLKASGLEQARSTGGVRTWRGVEIRRPFSQNRDAD
jgi:DNA-directed RNA polymerase specialized sigma subunit